MVLEAVPAFSCSASHAVFKTTTPAGLHTVLHFSHWLLNAPTAEPHMERDTDGGRSSCAVTCECQVRSLATMMGLLHVPAGLHVAKHGVGRRTSGTWDELNRAAAARG